MSVLPGTDMTVRDFDSLRARLIALVKSVFPDWTDFDVASFGNVLVEMYAFVGDVLSYYQDALARESRLVTATQRKNVMALARMLGYRLHGATAATAEVIFELARVPAADVLLPAGTVIRTQEVTEPIRFQLLEGVTILAGQTPPRATGVVEASESHTQRYDARGLADLDVHLDHSPYLDGSAVVTAGGSAYEEVDSFLGSGPNDRHFMVVVDQNDRATIRFGNGTNGAPPTGTIAVTYRTGGGAGGNVQAGTLVVVEGRFSDAHGRPVQVSVSNPEPASGGTDRESIAKARLLAPESLRAPARCVAREDFEINARRVPGVARALMLTSNEDPSIDENSGVLFVVPEGGGLPTPALKNLVLRQVTEVYPCTLTFQVRVQDAVCKRIDVAARVFLRQGHAPAAVRDRIRANLATMFRVSEADGTPNPRIDFGFNIRDADGNPAGEVAWSDVLNVVRDTAGVRKVAEDFTLNGLPGDVALKVRELPALGTITIVDGDRGSVL